ncbi:MAG: hypothetical protein LBO05_12850 [Deltaproteobacteria bacterium]|jgi:hypothetical protein|nr:hypothetical protein [Deltaproteobacteria bacterium]
MIVNCPHCHQAYQINPKSFGQPAVCENCGINFTIYPQAQAPNKPMSLPTPPERQDGWKPGLLATTCPHCNFEFTGGPKLYDREIACQKCGLFYFKHKSAPRA